jgi:penicillin G amidase
VLVIALCGALPGVDCARKPAPQPPLAAQVDGTIEVGALAAPVRVVRDRWGIPHIAAESAHDLFVAQGFVQAQDRLFQMDLWRRSVQGRLAEVLGPNFIERDAMTRRVQYRGDLQQEWTRYGPDARSIAEAFVEGVNAWADLAGQRPPEQFVLAGWRPDLWSADDLLNRIDGFDVRAAVDFVTHEGMDDVVADAVRRIGAAPVFSLLAAPVHGIRAAPADPARQDSPERSGSNRELVSSLAFAPVGGGSAEVAGSTLELAESHRTYEHPAARYLIHLKAPGWNVAGATAPWRPGIAVGHSDHFAWGLAPSSDPVTEIREQTADPSITRVITETLGVKGRTTPFEFQTRVTPGGVVIASDRRRGREFVLQWRGFDPGTAPELGALRIDRAGTAEALRNAAADWQLPPAQVVFVGREGRAGQDGQAGKRNGDRRTVSRAMFAHPLAITATARKRFDVGPLARPARDQQFQAFFDARDWDRSRIVNAPGESESPDSPHFADMAAAWAAGELVPFVFSDSAVQANAKSVLTLVPRGAAPNKR